MGKTEVEVVTINRLPEKITMLIDWEQKHITVFRHSVDVYRTIKGETMNSKSVSYDKMRRHLKRYTSIKLDSGKEIRESILIN